MFQRRDMEAVKPARFRRPFLWQRKALGKEKLFLKKGSYERKAGKAWSLSAFGGSNPPPCTPFFLEPREAKLHEASQTFWFARKRKLYQRKTASQTVAPLARFKRQLELAVIICFKFVQIGGKGFNKNFVLRWRKLQYPEPAVAAVFP